MLYFFWDISVWPIEEEPMTHYTRSFAIAGCAILLWGVALSVPFGNANGAETEVQRGKYLVSIIRAMIAIRPELFSASPI
jgi:hypothetical protein